MSNDQSSRKSIRMRDEKKSELPSSKWNLISLRNREILSGHRCRGFLIKYKFQFTALAWGRQLLMDTFTGTIFWDEKVGGSKRWIAWLPFCGRFLTDFNFPLDFSCQKIQSRLSMTRRKKVDKLIDHRMIKISSSKENPLSIHGEASMRSSRWTSCSFRAATAIIYGIFYFRRVHKCRHNIRDCDAFETFLVTGERPAVGDSKELTRKTTQVTFKPNIRRGKEFKTNFECKKKKIYDYEREKCMSWNPLEFTHFSFHFYFQWLLSKEGVNKVQRCF